MKSQTRTRELLHRGFTVIGHHPVAVKFTAVPGLLLCLLVCAVVAPAAVLTYNETSYPGGVFPPSGLPNSYPNIGTLGIGVNTITGVIDGARAEGTFSVTLPAGLIVTAGQWSITNFTFGGGRVSQVDGSVTETIDSTKDVNGNGILSLISVPYSTSGSINADVISAFSIQTVYGCCPPNATEVHDAGGFNYTLQYTVAADPASAPEPSSLALAGLGILTLAVATRRKRASR